MYDIVLGRSSGDVKKYGTKGAVLIGKQYVQMGQMFSLSNPIYMDVSRAHAMLIVGKRGSGKCLLGDSKIILGNGELVKIEELENREEDVCSLNVDYKIEQTKKTSYYKRNIKEIYDLKLRSGRNIKLTPEHPLLTVNSWEEVKKLKPGSKIATPRFIPVEGREHIGIHKAKLLGYLIAEGHLGNGFILFTNKDKVIINDFKLCINNFDNKLIIKDHGNYSYRIIQNNKRLTDNSIRDNTGKFLKNSSFDSKSSLRKYLEKINLYNTNSFTKFIPKEIFTSPNIELKEFLKALFSCDGSIYKDNSKHWKISYSSSSKEIIESVQHLLLRFEINGRFRKKNTNIHTISYELEIYGINVENFVNRIGFIGEKENKQKLMLKSIKNITRNSNLDTIPKEIWERYRPKSWSEIGRELNYKIPKSAKESIKYSPTREKLKKIGEIEENLEISNLANSDIFWDEIISIDKLIGNFKVYDITVPSFNNFVANDIIVHNSYTMGSIAEGLAELDVEISKNLAFVLLDTMGVYWSMKYGNKKEESFLKQWGLEGKGLDVVIFVPGGFFQKYKEDGIPVDFPFYIRPNELSIEDWMNAFKLKTDDPVGVGVQRVINKLLESGKNFEIEDIIAYTENDERITLDIKLAIINRFENCKTWGIFSKNARPIREILIAGKVSVMDLSAYVAMPGGWEVKALALGIIAKKIFVERMLVRKREELFDIDNKTQVLKKDEVEDDLPMPWLIVDEAHEFLPAGDEDAPSKKALMTILREGRQPGVSLILATQQPAKIHTDAITQSDIVLAHRLTSSFDLEALDKIFLSYDSKGAKALFNSMPRTKGCAIIMDDKNERLHTMQVKPRFTWHGGEDPNAIRDVKDEFDF